MPLPKKWQGFFVGRKVVHPNTSGLHGVVKYAESTRMGKVVPAGTGKPTIEFQFMVEWDNGESEVMEDTDVANIATDEFVKEDWVHERILKLQECGWDEAKADAMTAKPASRPRITAVTSSPPKAPRAAAGVHRSALPAAETKKRKAPAPASASERPAKKAAAPPSVAANGPPAAAAAPPAAEKPKASKKKASKKAEPSTSAVIGSPERPSTRPAAQPVRSPRHVAFPGASPRAPRPKPISSPFLHVEDLTPAMVRGKELFQYDLLTVDGTVYRVYCRDVIAAEGLCFRPHRDDGKDPDKSVDLWKIKEDYEDTGEFLVDCIVAERRVRRGSGRSGGSKAMEYLVKYTGFELDPGVECWLSRDEVDETEAFEAWQEKGGRKAWRAGVRLVHMAAGLEG